MSNPNENNFVTPDGTPVGTPFVTPSTSPTHVSPRRPKPMSPQRPNAKPVAVQSPKDAAHASAQEINSDPRSIILDPEVVTFIYNHVKVIALTAGPNSFKSLGYNVEMITIVGGTALTLYDQTLRSVKNKYDIDHLKRYVERDTLDIDAVWCLPFNSKIITFNARIGYYLDDFMKRFNTVKPASLPHQIMDMRCDKDISGIPYGTIHLKVFCTIDAVEYEIFDLAIHDSFSSQRFNEDYTEIIKPQYIISDPIYCHFLNTILLPFGKDGIRVPRMDVFIHQQLFAFGNFILHADGSNVVKGKLRPRSDKGYIHLRRVLYILHMLSLIRPNNAVSMQFFEAMQINPMHSIQYIRESIEIKRQVILRRLSQSDRVVDKVVFNKKMDMIMKEFGHEDGARPAIVHNYPAARALSPPSHAVARTHLPPRYEAARAQSPPRHAAAAARAHSPSRNAAARGHSPSRNAAARGHSHSRPALYAHVPVQTVRSNHTSPRHASAKSASAQVDPLDEIDNIIRSNKGLIRSFRDSFEDKSVIDQFQKVHKVHKVTDENIKRIKNFFHNINYKPYNIFSMKNPKGIIGLMEGVIKIGPIVKEFIQYVQIPRLLPVVDELIMHLHAIIEKIRQLPNSGGRRRTHKKRSTRKR